jgi:NAD(P)-dependent dehydrogenase (short-subunit alcohol dehydrogenase family)
LYYELQPFGIRVVIIEPGFIQTNIMNSSILAKAASNPRSPYFPLTNAIEKLFRSMVNDSSKATPSFQVANTIMHAVRADLPNLLYPVGEDAKMILNARKKLTERIYYFSQKSALDQR